MNNYENLIMDFLKGNTPREKYEDLITLSGKAEKKLEGLIYDLETSIYACDKIEKEYTEMGKITQANFAAIRLDVYKEILNKIK